MMLSCGSAIFVPSAGNREAARCGGGHISWQAQYYVCVGGVDVSLQAHGIVRLRVVVEVNVAVTWGCRVSGCCLEGLESRNCLAGLLD